MSVATQSLDMFGQVVIGPPGSGKTTYCAVMQEFLRRMGKYYLCFCHLFSNTVMPMHSDLVEPTPIPTLRLSLERLSSCA